MILQVRVIQPRKKARKALPSDLFTIIDTLFINVFTIIYIGL